MLLTAVTEHFTLKINMEDMEYVEPIEEFNEVNGINKVNFCAYSIWEEFKKAPAKAHD